jgi:hypothetical protein
MGKAILCSYGLSRSALLSDQLKVSGCRRHTYLRFILVGRPSNLTRMGNEHVQGQHRSQAEHQRQSALGRILFCLHRSASTDISRPQAGGLPLRATGRQDTSCPAECCDGRAMRSLSYSKTAVRCGFYAGQGQRMRDAGYRPNLAQFRRTVKMVEVEHTSEFRCDWATIPVSRDVGACPAATRRCPGFDTGRDCSIHWSTG